MMVVGDIPDPADLLVIGGGPGGYASAIAAAQSGRSVMLSTATTGTASVARAFTLGASRARH